MDNSVLHGSQTEHLGAPPLLTEAKQDSSPLSSLIESDVVQRQGQEQAQEELSCQNKLIQVRLGIASALFAALRAKHSPTAAHSLRVALGCSSWALTMEMTDQQRDAIEVSALLHDVGKIGVPDQIMKKPAKLDQDEVAIVDRHPQSGLEILSACCSSADVLDIVKYIPAWFDGSKKRFDLSGEDLPLGARIIAIVDAFDSMTTDHVYRRAFSRERAMAELFECAGTQFDTQLVKDFGKLLGADKVRLDSAVASRWLKDLDPLASNAIWKMGKVSSEPQDFSVDDLFQQKLVDSMHDGVVFVDRSLKILLWNRAAERLTGIPATGVLQQQWAPSLVSLRDENDRVVQDEDCPLSYAIQASSQNMQRLTIAGRCEERIVVDAQISPVVSRDGVTHGATLLLHDASSRVTLEEQVESLHVKATKDPLTGASNRAEFDQYHRHFVATHLDAGLPCSLIVCDLDFFKRINDNYGHPAGDEALVSFAALLKRYCGQGDLVARYGGEEFVMLCAACDNSTATQRAEEIRRELEQLPQASLGGKSITASFGVTEIQPGDTPDTMFRRADRALLQAKDLGRNTVVQLGSGISNQSQAQQKSGWLSWLKSEPPDQILQQTLISAVPLKVAVEKLRGFVADQFAEITEIDDEHVVLRIDSQGSAMARRRADRPVPFIVEMTFEETQHRQGGRSTGNSLRTLIGVSIRPIRNRDRRRGNVVERARNLLTSLKSYLMAQDYSGSSAVTGDLEDGQGVLGKAKSVLAPLFNKNQ